jgi:WD40 repeat protein/DNA-binding MarR family transcriptional regulator
MGYGINNSCKGWVFLIVTPLVLIIIFNGQQVASEEAPRDWAVSAIDWNPDGSYALIGGIEGLIARYDGKIIDVESNIQIEVNQIAWNPDGKMAIIAGNGGIYLFRDGLLPLKSGQNQEYTTIDWNPTGSYALIGGNTHFETLGLQASLLKYDGIELVDITGMIDDISEVSITKIAWNPKDDFALIYCDDGKLYEYREEKITLIKELDGILDLAWKPDGSEVSILFNDRSLASWDGNRPSDPEILTKGDDSIWSSGMIRWKPDGSCALIAGREVVYNQWRIYRYDGTMKFVEEMTDRNIREITWHPSGEYVQAVGSYESSGGMIQKIVIPNKSTEAALNPSLIVLSLISITTIVYFGFTETGRYFSLEFLFIPLFSKIKKKHPLENRMRELIYDYIELKPGENYSTIKKTLGLANGTLVYHLKILKKENLIKSVSDGRYKRFYPFESDELDQTMIYDHDGPQMLTDLQMKIIQKIEEQPEITQVEVARSLGVSRQVINYHILKLSNAGVLKLKGKTISKCIA